MRKRTAYVLVGIALSAANLIAEAQQLLGQQNGISLSYQATFVSTFQCGNKRYDQYRVTAFLTNNSGHTIDLNGFSNVDHIFYSNSFDVDGCRKPFPVGVTFNPKRSWPTNSTERGDYYVLVPSGNKLPVPAWDLPGYQLRDIATTPPRTTPIPPSTIGSPPANSGGSYNRPPTHLGNKYANNPAGNQPRGIPYGNDVKCLNCGNEIRNPLPPPPGKQPKGIPYGDDMKCLNCPKGDRVSLSPPGNRPAPPINSTNGRTDGNLTMIPSTAGNGHVSRTTQTNGAGVHEEDDELSKIDASNPEELAKWTIKEMDKLARETKCPATAAAYKKLADFLRCTLNGGNCGPLITAADIPDCPADN